MEEPEELTPSGSPVYRHKAIERDTELVVHRSAYADQVEEFLDKEIGPAPNVLHEIVSDRIHLDVHVCPPHGERDYFVLFTTGVTTRPMNVPEGAEAFRYAEFLMALPANWPGLANPLVDLQSPDHPWNNEEHYWPIRLFKSAAHMPAEYDTWLSFGHTISAGEGDTPFAPGTRLSTALIGYPAGFLEPDRALLHAKDGTTIFFYSVLPLYPEERDFKLKEGADALFDLFDKEGIGPVIDPTRKNVCAKKKRRWLW